MHRRSMRSAVVLVASCHPDVGGLWIEVHGNNIQQCSAGGQWICGFRQCRIGGRRSGGALAIKAELQVQIDKDGNEVAGCSRRHPGQPGRDGTATCAGRPRRSPWPVR